MTQENEIRLYPEDTDRDHADEVFRHIYRNQEPCNILNITVQVNAARDKFFRDWQDFIAGTEDGPENTRTDLWWYFDGWLADLRTSIFSGTPFPWLNPERAADIWHEFVQLVPTIYVAIIDAILKDPTKLDYVERDPKTRKEMDRGPRRVVDVLPHFWQRDGEEPKATPKEVELGGIVQLVAGCGGSWPVVNYRLPADRSDIDKWGPASM